MLAAFLGCMRVYVPVWNSSSRSCNCLVSGVGGFAVCVLQCTIECTASLCLTATARNEVWSCSHIDPYIAVWDSTSDRPWKKAEFPIPWGERGVSSLLTSKGCVWAACRDGTVLVWNAATRAPVMNVLDPATPVDHICHGPVHEVLGVSRRASHTVVVWKA